VDPTNKTSMDPTKAELPEVEVEVVEVEVVQLPQKRVQSLLPRCHEENRR